jgi:hypothetical protein
MKRSLQLLLVFLTLLLLLPACTPAPSAPPRPAPPVPASGKAVIVGVFANAHTFWEEKDLMAFAAPVFKNETGQGFYMLDTSVNPGVDLGADDSFQLVDIKPGEYVLLAGPTADDVRVVLDSTGKKPQSFVVKAGQVLDVGTLSFSQ